MNELFGENFSRSPFNPTYGAAPPLTAKIRSLAKPVPALLIGDRIVFDAPEYGVAPGQAAVLYAGDRVLGGGWIEETERALLAA